MKNVALKRGFTLIELLVVVAIIAILAGIALPVFTQVQVKGQQTKALSNAKQIALALRLYAADNNGMYPTYTLVNGQPSTATVADSNAAFAQLFPAYLQDEEVFWLPKSAFCSATPPDELTDSQPLDTPVNTLKAGENGWAYVLSLNDTSNPAVPILAVGFSDPSSHTYVKDQTQPGGLWGGASSVVLRADASGALAPVNQQDMTVDGPRGQAGTGDIFASGDDWLGAANVVVNPRTIAANTGGSGGGAGGDAGDPSAAEGAEGTLSMGNSGAGSTGAISVTGASSVTVSGLNAGITNGGIMIVNPTATAANTITGGGLTAGTPNSGQTGGALNFSPPGGGAGTLSTGAGGLNLSAGAGGLNAGGSGAFTPAAGGGGFIVTPQTAQ